MLLAPSCTSTITDTPILVQLLPGGQSNSHPEHVKHEGIKPDHDLRVLHHEAGTRRVRSAMIHGPDLIHRRVRSDRHAVARVHQAIDHAAALSCHLHGAGPGQGRLFLLAGRVDFGALRSTMKQEKNS